MSQIGAGAKIYLGTAADPNPDWATLSADQEDLDEYNINDKVSSFNIQTAQGTVDITKLNVNLNDFFRTHLAGLNDASGSANYGEDDPTGSFIIRIVNLMNGTNHPKGRAMVGFLLRQFGDATGYMQVSGVLSFTNFGQNTEIEAEIGGDMPFKVNGKLAYSQQA